MRGAERDFPFLLVSMYRNPVREGENKMRLRRIKFWLSVFEMKLINLPSICFRKKKMDSLCEKIETID